MVFSEQIHCRGTAGDWCWSRRVPATPLGKSFIRYTSRRRYYTPAETLDNTGNSAKVRGKVRNHRPQCGCHDHEKRVRGITAERDGINSVGERSGGTATGGSPAIGGKGKHV